jgi:hypothetical protein
MHVTEGSTVVDGTMTWQLNPFSEHFNLPELDVSYQGGNGTGGSFKLAILLLPARVVPGSKEALQIQFDCPSGGSGCAGDAAADVGATAGSPFRPAALAVAAKKTIVGSTHFSVASGRSAKIRVALNKTGRKLLAKRGSLKVFVRITLSKGTGLPHVITVGSVTFHKR